MSWQPLLLNTLHLQSVASVVPLVFNMTTWYTGNILSDQNNTRIIFLFFKHAFVISYTVLIFYILKGGAGVTCPPLCALMDPSYYTSCIFYLFLFPVKWKTFCPKMANGIWVSVSTLSCLWISWCAYLKRLIPAPFSHCGCWTLLFCADTLDPLIHPFVARTKVMAILLLT